MRRKKLIVWVGLVVLALTAGCDVLRFAPGEIQKQNAFVHQRTVAAAAQQARQEETSQTLQTLTSQAARQSEAIVAYYGLPQEIPPSETIEQLLQPANQTLADTARAEAIQRPDPWELADYLLELGIGCSGILGGAFGVKMARKLQLAREKTTALQEIVKNNESFKRDNPEYTEAFKQSQKNQSATTRTLVTALKE